MKKQMLHLVGKNGEPVSPSLSAAVEAAYHWAVLSFPRVDSAIVANMAERLATSMHENREMVESERRYAYRSMKRLVSDFVRSKGESEIQIDHDNSLVRFACVTTSFQESIDRSILFQQLETKLNDRDRHILGMLWRHDYNLAEIANELQIDYVAAKKAMQRVRERVAKCMEAAKTKGVHVRARALASTQDMAEKWI